MPTENIWIKVLFHILFVYIAYLSFMNMRKHKVVYPFIGTLVGCGYLIVFSHLFPSIVLLPMWSMYAAVCVIFIAAVFDYFLCRKHNVRCTDCC